MLPLAIVIASLGFWLGDPLMFLLAHALGLFLGYRAGYLEASLKGNS